jgi:ABC-type glycerol-3-phosphate transport system substrate-binding protein
MKGNFQIILIVVFIAAALFGILVFAGIIKIGSNSNQEGSQGTVVLWGTDKTQNLAQALENFNKANPTFTVKYVQKDSGTFDHDLLEALASGTGPDIFFISDELAYKYSNKIYTIPYTSYPLATFQHNFARAGEVFLNSKGMLAFPLAVDPLMMYYNRNTLDSNNIIYPPTTWDELQNLVPTLTQKDNSNKIIKSAVAMGQFSNVLHAKDILATLFMQLGNPIVSEKSGVFRSSLDTYDAKYDLSSVLQFYTDFADPLKNVYSWSSSLQNSQDSFSAEKLVFYFGYASEFQTLVDKNPNENFSVASMPQVKNTNLKLTFAHVTGLAISSFSKNFTTAFTAASLMATGDFATTYAKAVNVVPARRDLLAVKQTDAYSPIFYSSALYGASWLDPSESDTDNIFRNMIKNVLSNNMNPREAITDSSAKLDILFANQNL